MNEDFKDFIEVSGLLNYDPETISKIYKKNPKIVKKVVANTYSYFCYIFQLDGIKIR